MCKLLLFLPLVLFCLDAESAEIADFVNDGRLTFESRLRIERAEQDALRDADARTLRARLGWVSGQYAGFHMLVEGEHVEQLGGESYNSTTNGRVGESVIADPTATELNQAYLAYDAGFARLQYGRMVVELGNERFVGDVGFRQNQQTYDGLMLETSALDGQRLRYLYMTRAHRFLGDDHPIGEFDMRSHLLHYDLKRQNADKLTVYAYFIEMQNRSLTSRSHKTFGARYEGSAKLGRSKLIYAGELASQSDYADGAADNHAYYGRVEAGLAFPNAWFVGVGYERLSGDGDYGFQTPLATAHAFNGYADLFAGGTPVTGLDDRFVTARVPLGGVVLEVGYHDFRSDAGGIDYGDEVDASVSFAFADRWQIGAKFADYSADNFGTDTRRLWGWLEFNF